MKTYLNVLFYTLLRTRQKNIQKIVEFSKSLKLENEGRVCINNLKVMQK